MRRASAAVLLLAGMAMPVSAKVVCPPGQFTLHTQVAALDGGQLMLGEGDAAIADACGPVSAGDFHASTGRWLYHVRARWGQCHGRRLALRARFDGRAPWCTRLTGVLRVGRSRRVGFVADRIPVCGNALREAGEQCDEGHETPCCGLDCQVKPNCLVACDLRHFPCDADQLCVHNCGVGGACRPRAEVDCGSGPVCDCNEQTTYPDRCAAYEAGTGAGYPGPCRR